MATDTWTPEFTEKLVAQYVESEPTEDTTTEIIKKMAEEHEVSPNGLRTKLVQADVYIKKTPAASASAKDKDGKPKAKRLSKDDAIGMLRDAINKADKPVNEEIISKLTGKAALYFASLFTTEESEESE